MKNKNFKKAFTLVELIVVIIILTVLSWISLVAYNSYLSWVRDSNRISQISAIYSGLSSYNIKKSLPLPDDKINIEWSWWTVISYQWIAWETVLDTISFKKWWKDPKEKLNFIYYLTSDRKYLQLMWLAEEEQTIYAKNNIVWKIYAKDLDYTKRFVYVYWDKLWVLTEENTNMPINFLPSIRLAWSLDISTTTDRYTATFYSDVSVSGNSTVLSELEYVIKVWWKWCSFSWGLINCP